MIKAIRGMRDLLPPETSRWQWVESVAREVFGLYGYREVRLPLLERTELFARSIGASPILSGRRCTPSRTARATP